MKTHLLGVFVCFFSEETSVIHLANWNFCPVLSAVIVISSSCAETKQGFIWGAEGYDNQREIRDQILN